LRPFTLYDNIETEVSLQVGGFKLSKDFETELVVYSLTKQISAKEISGSITNEITVVLDQSDTKIGITMVAIGGTILVLSVVDDVATTGPLGIMNDVPTFSFGSGLINQGLELLNGY
jgi:hypothetical protein